jgi:hypothetical protein
MPRTVYLYAFLITLLIVGCRLFSAPELLNTPAPESSINTPTPEPTKTKLPALDGAWTIRMKHSGGIMGLSRSIEISSDGKFTVVDDRANKTITGEYSSDELSKIKERVSNSEYIAENGPNSMICADCFVYDLEIQGNGEIFTVQLSDISLPNSGLESLVNYLRNLIDTALKSK